MGCMKPLKVVVPEGCMLNPRHPAAVAAGNVETSQCVTDALYGALGVMGASQGTMNNFTFGTDRYQYYETICGGSGAGDGFHGADCVHTHMTNTRLTDPEVLEWRYPVLVEEFAVRRGSGGAGRWRGGDGAVRRIRFLEPMTAAILSGHRRVPPYGMAGGKPGRHIQGRALTPLLAGRKRAWRNSVLIEYWAENAYPWLINMSYKAVRTGRYKYIHWVSRNRGHELDELYDLAEDPFELVNLARSRRHAASRERLRRELRRLSADAMGL